MHKKGCRLIKFCTLIHNQNNKLSNFPMCQNSDTELYRILIYNHQEMKIGRVIKEDNSVISDITDGNI